MKVLYILLLFILVSCVETKTEYFTEEQKTSVMVDSAKIISSKTDLVEKIYLRDYVHNREAFILDEYIDTIQVLFLDDTLEDGLVGRINNVIVTEKYIYIMDNIGENSVVIFDIDGKFVKRIPNGNGPGEISKVYDITYDKYTHNIILTVPRGIAIYEENGEYIKSVLRPFQCSDFVCTEDGYICSQSTHAGYNEHLLQHQDNSILFVDRDFRLKWSALPHFNYTPHGMMYDVLETSEGCIRAEVYNDTIYSIDEKGVEAKYVLDLGEEKFPAEYANDKSLASLDVHNRVLEALNYTYLSYYLETQTHQFFKVGSSKEGVSYIFRDKQTKNIVGGRVYGYNQEILPILIEPRFISGDWFILPYHICNWQFSSSLISKEANKKFLKMDEESNMVLILYKLKQF